MTSTEPRGILNAEKRRKREAMENLVNDYVHNDNTEVSTILRTAIERGWYKDIKYVLADTEEIKQTEIDKICHNHYGEFLSSVKEIVGLKKCIQDLHGTMELLNRDFLKSGDELIDKVTELEKTYSEREEILSRYQSSIECSKLVQKMILVKESIATKQFNKAVTLILQIQKQETYRMKFLKELVLDRFWMNDVTQELLSIEQQDLDIFLTHIRQHSYQYGMTLLRRTASQFKQHCEQQYQDICKTLNYTYSYSTFYIWKISTILFLPVWAIAEEYLSIPSTHYKESYDKDEVVKLSSLFNELGPVCHALYTFITLNKGQQLLEHYRQERLAEIDKLIKGAVKAASKHGVPTTFSSLISLLVGFFSVETLFGRCITEYDEKFIPFTLSEVRSIWEMTCRRVFKLIKKFHETIMTPNEILCMKDDILLLMDTVSDACLDLSTDTLMEILDYLWELFEDRSIIELKKKVEGYFAQYLWQPHTIKTAEDYQNLIQFYQLDLSMENTSSDTSRSNPQDDSHILNLTFEQYLLSRKIETSSLSSSPRGSTPVSPSKYGMGMYTSPTKGGNSNSNTTSSSGGNLTVRYPVTYHHSSAVPLIMRELHLLVSRCFIFMYKCNFIETKEQHSVCHVIIHAIECITDILQILLTIDGSDTTIAKACQLAIDTAVLNQGANSVWMVLDHGLSHMRWSHSLQLHLPRAVVVVKNAYGRIMSQSQAVIYEILGEKVDDLLTSMQFIDFEPVNIATECHSYVEEITDYLRVTFSFLNNLPRVTIEGAYFTCLTRVAHGIVEFLVSNKVKRMNVKCIQAFSIDILKFQKFADDCLVPHLRQCLNELVDLISALLSYELGNFIIEQNGTLEKRTSLLNAYPSLNIPYLTLLLDKIIAEDRPMTIKPYTNQGGSAVPYLYTLDQPGIKDLVKKFKRVSQT